MNQKNDVTWPKVLGCFGMGIFTAAGTGWLIHAGGSSILSIIMGILVTVLMLTAGIFGLIWMYQSKHPDAMRDHLAKSRHDEMIQQKKQNIMSQQKRHATMLQEVFWHGVKKNVAFMVVFLIIGIIFLFAQYSNFVDLWLIAIAMGVYFLMCLGILLWNVCRGLRYYLLKEIKKQELDLKSINDDYMRGTAFSVGADRTSSDLFNISDQYSILVHNRGCMIIPTKDIKRVTTEQRSYTIRGIVTKETQTKNYVVIFTETQKYWFSCIEVNAELILREYKHRGIVVY